MSLELLLILKPGHPLSYLPHHLVQHSSPGQGCLLPIIRVLTRPVNHHGRDGLLSLGVNLTELARVEVGGGLFRENLRLEIGETSNFPIYLKHKIKLDF